MRKVSSADKHIRTVYIWIIDSTLLQHVLSVDVLQATRLLWLVPRTRTWRTAWPSSSPPWSLFLSERLVQPPASTPSWRTAASLPPAGLVETCVMPRIRTAQASSAFMGASQSEITCQPRVSMCNHTHIHVSLNMRLSMLLLSCVMTCVTCSCMYSLHSLKSCLMHFW